MKDRRYNRKPQIFELGSIWVERHKHKCRANGEFIPKRVGEIGWVKVPGQKKFAVFWNGTHLQEVLPRIAGEFSLPPAVVTPMAPSWEATDVTV